MKFNFIKNNRKNYGFTLVETLVAITIFTISLSALFTVLSQGIANTNYAKQKMTATYLAQEGIEYIRNMRDTYMLYPMGSEVTAQDGWTDFNNKLKSASCDQNAGCYFDPASIFSGGPRPMTQMPVIACATTCPTLIYLSSTGEYQYDNPAGTNSGFTRTIQAVVQNSDETKIYSKVTWMQGSGLQTVSFSENLYDWIQ